MIQTWIQDDHWGDRIVYMEAWYCPRRHDQPHSNDDGWNTMNPLYLIYLLYKWIRKKLGV